jgi:hypothetical protein
MMGSGKIFGGAAANLSTPIDYADYEPMRMTLEQWERSGDRALPSQEKGKLGIVVVDGSAAPKPI